MKISDVVASGYKNVFEGQPEADKTHQVKAIQYLLTLAANMKVNIGEWDLFEVFGSGDGKIFQKKQSLNERFFLEVATLPQTKELPAKVVEIAPELMVNLSKAIESHKRTQIESFERDRDSYVQAASDRYSQATAKLKQAAQCNKCIHALEGTSEDLLTELTTIVQKGFWHLHGFTTITNMLEFHTVGDCHQSLVNSAAGVDINVNFGRFKALVNVQESTVYVYPLERNLEVSGYIHPHISAGSTVCWGNAADMVSKALPKLHLACVMEALSVILTHYNEESPYCMIQKFYFQQNGTKPTQSELTVTGMWYCAACGMTIENGNDCDCPTCRVCDERYQEDNGRECDCCYDCERESCDCQPEEQDVIEPVMPVNTTAVTRVGSSFPIFDESAMTVEQRRDARDTLESQQVSGVSFHTTQSADEERTSARNVWGEVPQPTWADIARARNVLEYNTSNNYNPDDWQRMQDIVRTAAVNERQQAAQGSMNGTITRTTDEVEELRMRLEGRVPVDNETARARSIESSELLPSDEIEF